MILIIDNYDSFTYNLYQYIGEINPNVRVIRNDKTTPEEIERAGYTHIILSPGPGYPISAGITIEVIKRLGGKLPILGVCLGHQAICEAYGAKIVHANELMHGAASELEIDNSSPLFKELPNTIMAGRYHSLIAKPDTLPNELRVTAKTKTGEIMAVMHNSFNVYGIQFHPESVLTPMGKTILNNFLSLNGGVRA